MRAVVQRVSQASVEVGGEIVGRIGRGLLVLVGVAESDGERQAEYLANKVSGLRIFEDDDGRMNRSVVDVGGSILAVSQFTLLGDVRKGRRPSFVKAAQPEKANQLYEGFVDRVRRAGIPVETGRFRSHMEVNLTNDGPVTIWIDSDDVASGA